MTLNETLRVRDEAARIREEAVLVREQAVQLREESVRLKEEALQLKEAAMCRSQDRITVHVKREPDWNGQREESVPVSVREQRGLERTVNTEQLQTNSVVNVKLEQCTESRTRLEVGSSSNATRKENTQKKKVTRKRTKPPKTYMWRNVFTCKVCSIEFPMLRELNKHKQQFHSKPGPRFCEICNKRLIKTGHICDPK